ncbi:unannotated protein [freshwater metagenome]|uniref:Unannotated protein n=1 Tax=freshwater metagenome TaxID=449393 RepID=A0A6J7LEI9_9ZZZZ
MALGRHCIPVERLGDVVGTSRADSVEVRHQGELLFVESPHLGELEPHLANLGETSSGESACTGARDALAHGASVWRKGHGASVS